MDDKKYIFNGPNFTVGDNCFNNGKECMHYVRINDVVTLMKCGKIIETFNGMGIEIPDHFRKMINSKREVVTVRQKTATFLLPNEYKILMSTLDKIHEIRDSDIEKMTIENKKTCISMLKDILMKVELFEKEYVQ